MNSRALFVTGTDTAVGKTVVTALLGCALRRRGVRVAAMKPVATGCDVTEQGLVSADALFIREKLALDEPVELINPVRYAAPAAPAVAAKIEGRAVDLAACDRAFESLKGRHESVLVEGIGGLFVPIAERFTVADLALQWRLPLLIVGRPGLGTINHTALTVHYARSKGLRVIGFLFNTAEPLAGGIAEETNPRCVEELCGVPYCGSIPHGGSPLSDPHLWERMCEAADRILAGPLKYALPGC